MVTVAKVIPLNFLWLYHTYRSVCYSKIYSETGRSRREGVHIYGQSLWESAIIGSGMIGRGAVEMVIAAVVIELSDKLIAGHTITEFYGSTSWLNNVSHAITEPLLTKDQFSTLI